MPRKISLVAIIFCTFFFAASHLFARDDALNNIEALILKDSYSQAAKECADIIVGKYRSSEKSKAQYLLGVCLLKQTKHEQARKQFNYVISRYPSSKYYDDAQLGIADSYFLSEDRNQAAKLYKKFLRDFPRSELTSIARTHLNQCTQGGHLSNSYFSVQVGCFGSKKNAKNLCDTLINRGYQGYILEVASDDLYHVRVGKFSTRLQAEFLEQKLKAEGYETTVCP